MMNGQINEWPNRIIMMVMLKMCHSDIDNNVIDIDGSDDIDHGDDDGDVVYIDKDNDDNVDRNINMIMIMITISKTIMII